MFWVSVERVRVLTYPRTRSMFAYLWGMTTT